MKWNPMDECEFIWCRWVRGVFVLWFDWNRVQVTKQKRNMVWKKIGMWCMCMWSHVWVTLRSAQNSAWESKDSPQWQTQRQDDFNENSNVCPLSRISVGVMSWHLLECCSTSMKLPTAKSDTCTPSERGSSTPSESHTKYQLSTCKSTWHFFQLFWWMKASLNKRDNPKKKKHQSNTLCSNFYLLKLMRRDDGLQGLGFSV